MRTQFAPISLALTILAAGSTAAPIPIITHALPTTFIHPTTNTAAVSGYSSRPHDPPPSDARVCLTNILMTYFRFARVLTRARVILTRPQRIRRETSLDRTRQSPFVVGVRQLPRSHLQRRSG